MEENENKLQEEEAVQPSREEILAASRKENKNGDERDSKIYFRGTQIALSVAMLLMGVIQLACVFLNRAVPAELWMVYMGMLTTWAMYYGIKSGKRRPLFISCGVLGALVFAMFTTIWILQLCGVM